MSMSLPPDESSQTDVPGTHTASWWEILCSTPVRDVIHGDWSSRYKQLLRSSALPRTIAERISRIVRKASLWRNERNDVTRELIAHFQEGLDRGVSAALLVEQFGDVKTTARLIRRAKLRKRPIWWKTWYGASRSIVVLLAVLLVLYVVQAVRFFTGKPVITRNIVKELNDHVRKIPVEDRAWPLYVEAMKGFPEWPKGILEFEKISPHMEQWPEVVKFAHANKDRVAAIRRAAKKPRLGWLIGDPNDPAFQMSDADDERFAGVKTDRQFLEDRNPSSLELKMPIYRLVMEMSRLLQLSTKVAVQEENANEVYDNMIASFGLADQVLQADGTAIIIVQLSGISIFRPSNTLLLEILARHRDLLSVEQLEGIKRRLEVFHSGKVIRFSFEAERLLFVDLLQRTYTPGDHGILTYAGGKQVRGWYLRPGNETFGDSAFYWIDLLGPIAMTIAVDRSEAQSEFDVLFKREITHLSSRPWEWGSNDDGGLQQFRAFFGYFRNPIAALAYPSVRSVAEKAEDAELDRNTAMIALALTIFKRQEGHWPDRLDELVPRYLPSLPPDPADGQPLRYKLTESGPMVYSIGEDRHDDGGRATLIQMEGRDRFTIGYMNPEKRDAIQNNPNNPRNGDWILWPPVEKKSE
ncbi:hypothetical protein K2Y11_22090 [bacterium]|nr:hypothetical protein [bacterium]